MLPGIRDSNGWLLQYRKGSAALKQAWAQASGVACFVLGVRVPCKGAELESSLGGPSDRTFQGMRKVQRGSAGPRTQRGAVVPQQ